MPFAKTPKISIVLLVLCLIFTLLLGLGCRLGHWLYQPTSKRLNPVEWAVILGGGWEFREKVAADLYQRRIISKILITGMPDQFSILPVEQLPPSYSYLLTHGVAQKNIALDNTAKNTWEEIQLIKRFLISHNQNTVIIITDPPHQRRVSWLCLNILQPNHIEFTVVGSSPDWWNTDNWWRNTTAFKFSLLELVKIIYYQFRYNITLESAL